MNIRRYFFPLVSSLFLASGLTSCLGDDDNSYDYKDWINQNETYLAEKEAAVDASGKKLFEKVVPSWCPGVYVLSQWHNDRSKTAANLVPMDNSTVDVIYECLYVNGTVLDSSYSNTTYGDSVYRCKPSDNIVGFWTMLTNMHVGDSVTCVIPMNAAYGVSSTRVVPYSTLIYNMKLKAIHAYEVSGK